MDERLSLHRLSQLNDVETFVPNTTKSLSSKRTSSRSRPSHVDPLTEMSTHGVRKISRLAPSTVQHLCLASLPRLASAHAIDAEILEPTDRSLRSPIPSKLHSRQSRRSPNSPSPTASTRSPGILSSFPAPKMLSASVSTSCLKRMSSSFPTRLIITSKVQLVTISTNHLFPSWAITSSSKLFAIAAYLSTRQNL